MNAVSTKHVEERRVGYAEIPEGFMEKINKHIDEENGFFKGLYIIAGVLAIVTGLITWIFLEDHAKGNKMQESINEHTVQNARTLTILEHQVTINAAQQQRIDANTQLLYGHIGEALGKAERDAVRRENKK